MQLGGFYADPFRSSKIVTDFAGSFSPAPSSIEEITSTLMNVLSCEKKINSKEHRTYYVMIRISIRMIQKITRTESSQVNIVPVVVTDC